VIVIHNELKKPKKRRATLEKRGRKKKNSTRPPAKSELSIEIDYKLGSISSQEEKGTPRTARSDRKTKKTERRPQAPKNLFGGQTGERNSLPGVKGQGLVREREKTPDGRLFNDTRGPLKLKCMRPIPTRGDPGREKKGNLQEREDLRYTAGRHCLRELRLGAITKTPGRAWAEGREEGALISQEKNLLSEMRRRQAGACKL